MHSHSIEPWTHRHVFLGARHDRHERRTWFVVGLTAAMMVAEIAAGHIFGSMALLADGWHMSTHASALAIAALAYRFARRHASDERFSFGTGKIGELAGFASAIILGLVSLFILAESLGRLFVPVPIRFHEALLVAATGLAVNIVGAWLLFERDPYHRHGHEHHHHHAGEGHGHHRHRHHHRDTNIRAAYLHVLADALTSVLAILALLAGSIYGWMWLDPVIGMVGGLVIAKWSLGLLRSAGEVLLDMVPSRDLAAALRACLEVDGDRVADLHIWRLGPGHMGAILSIVSDHPQAPEAYKSRLSGFDGLSHVTIEVQACHSHAPKPLAA